MLEEKRLDKCANGVVDGLGRAIEIGYRNMYGTHDPEDSLQSAKAAVWMCAHENPDFDDEELVAVSMVRMGEIDDALALMADQKMQYNRRRGMAKNLGGIARLPWGANSLGDYSEGRHGTPTEIPDDNDPIREHYERLMADANIRDMLGGLREAWMGAGDDDAESTDDKRAFLAVFYVLYHGFGMGVPRIMELFDIVPEDKKEYNTLRIKIWRALGVAHGHAAPVIQDEVVEGLVTYFGEEPL